MSVASRLVLELNDRVERAAHLVHLEVCTVSVEIALDRVADARLRVVRIGALDVGEIAERLLELHEAIFKIIIIFNKINI